MARWKLWVLGAAAVIIDLAVYASLGVMMMGYDDHYNGDPAQWGAWHTLSAFDKKVFITLDAWHVVNVTALGYVLFKTSKRFRKRNQSISVH
jgi:hypothetical protein